MLVQWHKCHWHTDRRLGLPWDRGEFHRVRLRLHCALRCRRHHVVRGVERPRTWTHLDHRVHRRRGRRRGRSCNGSLHYCSADKCADFGTHRGANIGAHDRNTFDGSNARPEPGPLFGAERCANGCTEHECAHARTHCSSYENAHYNRLYLRANVGSDERAEWNAHRRAVDRKSHRGTDTIAFARALSNAERYADGGAFDCRAICRTNRSTEHNATDCNAELRAVHCRTYCSSLVAHVNAHCSTTHPQC